MSDKIKECSSDGKDAQKPVCRAIEEKQIEKEPTVLSRITLEALCETDCMRILEWRNNYDIFKWCRQNDFISDASQREWFNKQHNDPTIRMYRIVWSKKENAEWKKFLAGVCGLTSIDWIVRKAEFSLYIGTEFQGQNFGEIALDLLLDHGFHNLNLNLIWGEVIDGNPALKKFLQTGFEYEGKRRNFYYKDGEYLDAHLISFARKKWKQLRNMREKC